MIWDLDNTMAMERKVLNFFIFKVLVFGAIESLFLILSLISQDCFDEWW